MTDAIRPRPSRPGASSSSCAARSAPRTTGSPTPARSSPPPPIADGDFDSWFDAWTATARRVADIAAAAEGAGRRISARDAWLRASFYHSLAFFYVLGTRDPSRGPASFRALRAAFDRAIALWPTPAGKVEIPYQGRTLKGYWFSPDADPRPRPLIILNNGSDGQVAGMLRHGGIAAVERGWHALVFDGPGQGTALYDDNLAFRPDWEAVITPVVDYALTRPGVDPQRIALLGVSQGGYWVPRAAAFEHRLAAVVADPGVMRVWSSWYDSMPPDEVAALDTTPRDEYDAGVAEGLSHAPASMRFELAKRAEPYRIASLHDLLREVRRYDLTGVAERIACPTLVTDPENESFWPGQSAELHAALTCPKTLMRFSAAEGAAGHCEPLAPGLFCQRVFDWLEETLQAR